MYLAALNKFTVMNKKIVVGITQGDTNGVGYEVIIKSLATRGVLDLFTPILYGSAKIFAYYRRALPDVGQLNTNLISNPSEARPRMINIINILPEEYLANPGNRTEEGAKGALLSLEAATADLKSGAIDLIVTAPFNKSSVSQEGFHFPGHTEYFTEQFGVEESLMIMCSEEMKVGVVTNHLPLKEVSAAITRELIVSKTEVLLNSLKRDFAIDRPKVALLSLNPHGGDEGLLGSEEGEVVIPAVEELFNRGELVYGPFPADGFFGSNYRNQFDAILALYHDQGLVPFKLTNRERGVNYTAGLPIVRTSPDHGTAFDIAGKGVANHNSFLASIFTACDIFRNRREFEQLSSNPLVTSVPGSVKKFD